MKKTTDIARVVKATDIKYVVRGLFRLRKVTKIYKNKPFYRDKSYIYAFAEYLAESIEESGRKTIDGEGFVEIAKTALIDIMSNSLGNNKTPYFSVPVSDMPEKYLRLTRLRDRDYGIIYDQIGYLATLSLPEPISRDAHLSWRKIELPLLERVVNSNIRVLPSEIKNMSVPTIYVRYTLS
jgi:hypothetical protein